MFIEKHQKKSGSFPYNNYINIICDKISKPCWIIVLDDDDMFTTKFAVEIIMKHISIKYLTQELKCENIPLFMWITQFSKSIYLPIYSKENIIRPDNVPSCSFMFHSSFTTKAKWPPSKGGDYVFSKQIKDINKNTIVWLPFILTRLQNIPGLGKCVDLHKSELQMQNETIITQFRNNNNKKVLFHSEYGPVQNFYKKKESFVYEYLHQS